MKMDERMREERKKKRRRERERERRKGPATRQSPVTPDEDKTGAWRDGPKAQWGGLSNASFTSYEVLLVRTTSPLLVHILLYGVLQQLDTDTTENSIHFQIRTRLTGITTNFGNDGQASEGCLLLFVSSFFCWSLEYIYPSMFSDY